MSNSLMYKLLTTAENTVLTDTALIERALLCEKKESFNGFLTDYRINDQIQKIDEMIQALFRNSKISYVAYGPCLYGILNPQCGPQKLISQNGRVKLQVTYDTLFIQIPGWVQELDGVDVVLSLANFLEHKNHYLSIFQKGLEVIQQQGFLEERKSGFYWNQRLIVTQRSVVKKEILKILLAYHQQQKGKWVFIEEIAKSLEQALNQEIADLHDQVQRPLLHLRQKSDSPALIEKKKRYYRLNPHLFFKKS